MKISTIRNFSVESNIPQSVRQFIHICLVNNIELVLHGGTITDSFFDIKPNDYDFYVGCTYEHFMMLVGNPMNLTLCRYGDYITPSEDVYYCFLEDHEKCDLMFLNDKPFEPDFLYSQLYKRGIVTISSSLYFLRTNRFVDNYHAITDTMNKTIRLADIQSFSNYEALDKTFVLYFTFLCGKYYDFTVDKEQLEMIRNYIWTHKKMAYFERFPWRIPAGLARIFRYSQVGLENIINYWKQTELFPIFLGNISVNLIEEIFLNIDKSSEEKLYDLNKASNGNIADVFRKSLLQLPQDFVISQNETIQMMKKCF